ncbi:MAG: hypothetical protein ACI4O7_02890 [Aristaeellaceae bacterium]
MPFMPQYYNVVILYGNEAIDHFDSLLQYWKPFFTTAMWKKFMFISVSCDGHQPRLHNAPRLAGFSMTIDPENRQTWTLKGTTLDLLQAELQHHKVMVHCICADYAATPTMPAQVPVYLIRSIYQRLSITNATCALFMMLHGHPDAVEAQRALVSEIVDAQQLYQGTFEVVPYLICPTDSTNALYSDSMLWRCIMCEMLVLSSGHRVLDTNAVYTLGYTSLNADDSELTLLREQAVCDIIARQWSEPISHEYAWWLLTQFKSPNFSAASMETQVQNWLLNLAKDYLPPLEWRSTGMNLCILQHIESADQIGRLYPAIMTYIRVNRAYSKQRACEAMRQHVASRMEALLHVMNLAQFPTDFLTLFFNTLDKVAGYRIEEPEYFSFPQKKRLQSMDSYLQQCFESVQPNALRLEQQRFAVYLAQQLQQEMKPLKTFLQTVSSAAEGFQNVLGKQMEELSGVLNIEHLKAKYPPYIQHLDNMLLAREREIFNADWFASQPSLITPAGVQDPDALRSMIVAGGEHLHQQLGVGYDKGFITALKAMLSDTAMLHFLDDNLVVRAPLLHFIGVNADPIQNVRLADSEMHGVIDADFFIDNDNIEQIQLYRCQYPLSWFVGSHPAAQQNIYLGQNAVAPAPGIDGQDSSITPWDMVMTPSPAVPPASTPTPALAQPRDENPHHIALIPDGSRYRLVWDWVDGMETAVVYINNQHSFPHDISKDFPDVTDLLVPGRNEIRIFRGGVLYARYNVLGKQIPVPYTFLTGSNGTVTLKIASFSCANKDDMLFLRCIRGNGTVTLYPIYGSNEPEPMLLKGLVLPGKIDVVPSPNNPFPRLMPQRH